MSLYNGPPRAGARGGRDQFNWESVRSDKDREFYLGHSVKAATGRWQKGKDLFWYTREKADEASMQDELAAVKAREQELMMEALGLKPQSVRGAGEAQLDQQELHKLLQRGGGGEGQEHDPSIAAGGLGFVGGGKGPAAITGATHEVMQGEGLPPAGGLQLPPPPPGPRPAGGEAGGAAGGRRSVAELEEALRRQEKAAKRARKEAKKAKEHKEKGSRRSRSRSRSRDRSREKRRDRSRSRSRSRDRRSKHRSRSGSREDRDRRHRHTEHKEHKHKEHKHKEHKKEKKHRHRDSD